jgi:hypothetical protein
MRVDERNKARAFLYALTEQERIENERGRIEEFSNRLSNASMVLESSSYSIFIDNGNFSILFMNI